MRPLAAAAVLLLALVVGALAPKIWGDDAAGVALASGRPVVTGPLATVASTAFAPVSWRTGKDGGAGYIVCGSTDNWSRPTIAEQNAHLASDPRYAHMRADDPGSEPWTEFRANALLFDGSTVSARVDLVALTGLWTDPHIGGNAVGCNSIEPQVWLFGYAPISYHSDDIDYAFLNVVAAPGYRMVVLTGTIRPHLVVASSTKLAVLTMPANAIASTPAPLPKPTVSVPPSAAPSTFPVTDRPVELALPSACRIQGSMRHEDGLGAAFTVQCGSAEANLGVAVAAMRQGWAHLSGPPIGVGLQNYAKGTLTMQLAYRLDAPGYSAPFQLVQYSRPFSAGLPSAASPFAYLREPTGIELPAGCAWGNAPAGFTSDGAYKIPFSCPRIKLDQIQATFTRAIESQGWHADNGGFVLSYAKGELRLTASFANTLAEPSDSPWVVEALCCYAP